MNPIFFILLRSALPYAIAMIVGFGLAFGIQGLRLTHAEQEFAQYKLDQQQLVQRQIDQANAQRKAASDDFLQTKAALEKKITVGDAYRRCVAAGRCGIVRSAPACPGATVSPAPGIDAAGADAVPAPAGDAAINDCAVTTLMLNKLPADIEAQPGY